MFYFLDIENHPAISLGIHNVFQMYISVSSIVDEFMYCVQYLSMSNYIYTKEIMKFTTEYFLRKFKE